MASSLESPLACPLATYRLQVNPGFTLDDSARIADYLAALGVSHIYTSPLLQAAPGSTHGYDVVDPTRINDELGGMEGYIRFSDRLASLGLGHVLDIVPNHMSTTTPGNRWWWDVLAHGPVSKYARYFDIDWTALDQDMHNRVVVPVLGQPLEEAVRAGEVRLELHDDSLVLVYGNHWLPITAEAGEMRSLADALANGGVPAEELLELVGRQHYVLTHWRAARIHLNYRRFFTISSLVGMRAFELEVFEATHALAFRLIREGRVHGLRIDHPDGLRDPETYLERLKQATGGIWTVVEKILERTEQLRPYWPVAGTTGYEFGAIIGGLFLDPAGEGPLTELYAWITGEHRHFDEVAQEKRHRVLREGLEPEMKRLARLFERAIASHPDSSRYSPPALHAALGELLACFPVYRSYVRPRERQIDDEDMFAIREATSAAKARRPDLGGVLELLRDVLLLDFDSSDDAAKELIWRFQQVSSAAMAKGVEDTAFYSYNRFIALNEVGNDPSVFATAPRLFHAFCLERQACWPTGLNATSTHDTKRSEDVRARLFLLSEMPAIWADVVHRWSERNQRHRQGGWIDRNMEYFIYQTLVGAHPLPLERAWPYILKAAREASTHTSWIEPNPAYEAGLQGFVEGLLGDPEFCAELDSFVTPLIAPGRINSLAQMLLKLTAPGVPDLYQGTELWNLSLVDPDNRRPVDYELRRSLLARLEQGMTLEEILAGAEPGSGSRSARSGMDALGHDAHGLSKLWLVRQALHLRRQYPESFGPRSLYRPLWAEGERSRHVIAYQRAAWQRPDGPASVTVVPRLVWTLAGNWRDTRIELGRGPWHNVVTGEQYQESEIALAELLARFPVALLVRDGDRDRDGSAENREENARHEP